MRFKKLTLATVLAMSMPLQAVELGVQGTLFPIEEVDFRQLFLESAARMDADGIQKQYKQSVEQFFDRLPVHDLPAVEKDRTVYQDMSVPLPQDVTVPVKNAKGVYEWKTFFKKGDRINPLDYVKLEPYALVIDGTKKDHVDVAKKVLETYNLQIQVVLTKGNPNELAEKLRFPIHYLQPEFQARFNVQAQPALIFQPQDGEYEKFLGTHYFAKPFTFAKVQEVLSSKARPLPTLGFKSNEKSNP